MSPGWVRPHPESTKSLKCDFFDVKFKLQKAFFITSLWLDALLSQSDAIG